MSAQPYRHAVPTRQIPDGGRRFKVEANAVERQAIAELLGIVEVASLSAELDVRPVGADAFSVKGSLSSAVVQTDVVTLEPVRQEIGEEIDLTLIPAAAKSSVGRQPDDSEAQDGGEDRDFYRAGEIDLGAIVFEHLALGLDPYPRSPGTEFSGHLEDKGEGDRSDSPFAALAALKRERK